MLEDGGGEKERKKKKSEREREREGEGGREGGREGERESVSTCNYVNFSCHTTKTHFSPDSLRQQTLRL